MTVYMLQSNALYITYSLAALFVGFSN